MLNLLIFNPFALENGRGGEISTIELTEGLKKYFNITLVDTNKVLGKPLLTKNVIYNKIKGIKRYIRVKYATINIFNREFGFPLIKTCKILNKLIKNNDIVHFSFINIKTTLLFIFLSLIRRKTEFIVAFRKPLFSDKIISLYNLKYRISILFLSLFKKRFSYHTISLHAKQYLSNFFEEEKIYHIKHCVDLSNFKPKENLGSKPKNLTFIYVGSLDDVHKGFGYLLNAINKFLVNNRDSNVTFEICGQGPLSKDLNMLQKRFPDNIKYHGYVSNEKIGEYYRRGDVFLFSSRREPLGRVIIEALASNLIIICTKTIGSIEILKDQKFAFFLNKLTIEEFLKNFNIVIDLWQNHYEEFLFLQKAAREYALEKYSFEIELNEVKKLIKTIIIKK